MAELLYNIKITSTDVADAILIGTHTAKRLVYERKYAAANG